MRRQRIGATRAPIEPKKGEARERTSPACRSPQRPRAVAGATEALAGIQEGGRPPAAARLPPLPPHGVALPLLLLR